MTANRTLITGLEKPVILIFIRHYLPGFQSGGPVRSVSNMVYHLSDYYDFRIVTSDRDYLDKTTYENIKQGWQEVNRAQVLYISPEEQHLLNLIEIVREIKPDVIYLNSFFDPVFSLPLLWSKWIHNSEMPPLITAPRGELSPGALALKALKKNLFLRLFNMTSLKKQILFHATSLLEEDQIKSRLGPCSQTALAGNLGTPSMARVNRARRTRRNPDAPLKITFISRIHPKKNLDYLIDTMAECRFSIALSIFGPVDDEPYWQKCREKIEHLPTNISVHYGGAIEHDLVIPTLAEADLFFLPTRGENFGHIIHEAILAGCVTLLSDQTPWVDLEEKEIGWALPLNQPQAFVNIISEVAAWTPGQWQAHADAISTYAQQRDASGQEMENHLVMFRNAIEKVQT